MATPRRGKKSVESRAGHRLNLTLQEKRFPRSIYFKHGAEERIVEQAFLKKVRPEFEKFYRAQKKRKNGDQYIFTMLTGMNFSGKRIKHGFSNRRVRIRSLKEFDRVMTGILHNAKKGFLAKLKKYLSRSGLNTFSIRGVKMEVAKNARSKSNPPKRSTRQAGKTVRSR